MRRPAIAMSSALFLIALSWPAVSPSEIDSLPLSNYSMFASPRPPVSSFNSAVLIDSSGVERRLDPHAVGGTEEPVQAAMTLRQAIRNDSADALCEEIAAGVDVAGTIEVVTERYDSVAWFQGQRDPVERTVHARCRSDVAP